ncbi:MAG: hypothetical protein RIG82_04220 [Phycisphaeraceae bacterium]
MRNLFDQYRQPENQLTHALASTLNADRTLIRPFLAWVGIASVPPVSRLRITEQQIPGSAVSGEETEAKGLPDACIYDGDGWALLIEAKVQAAVSVDQLRRHRRTAERHGYPDAPLLLLTDQPTKKKLPKGCHSLLWRDVYGWFRNKNSGSCWARTFTEFVEIFETKMLDEAYGILGTLTMFDGLRFDKERPYHYREAKRLIRLLGDELQANKTVQKLGADPEGERRAAITRGESDSVWDYLPLKAARGSSNFTAYPHLTLSLKAHQAVASITIPNGVRGGFRTRLKYDGPERFFKLVEELEAKMRPVVERTKSGQPMIYVLQRHYRSQRSVATVDARLEADLRTLVRGSKGGVKYQPEWLDAVYSLLTKKQSNIQLGIDLRMSYACGVVQSPKVVDLIASTWDAMSPMLEYVIQTE